MNREQKIKALKEIQSGTFKPGETITWKWSTTENTYACNQFGIPLEVPKSEFQSLVDRLGGKHYIFSPGVVPYDINKVYWFSSDFYLYGTRPPHGPSWFCDPIPPQEAIDKMYPRSEFEQVEIEHEEIPQLKEPETPKPVEEIEIEPVEPSQYLREFTFRLSDSIRNRFNRY